MTVWSSRYSIIFFIVVTFPFSILLAILFSTNFKTTKIIFYSWANLCRYSTRPWNNSTAEFCWKALNLFTKTISSENNNNILIFRVSFGHINAFYLLWHRLFSRVNVLVNKFNVYQHISTVNFLAINLVFWLRKLNQNTKSINFIST